MIFIAIFSGVTVPSPRPSMQIRDIIHVVSPRPRLSTPKNRKRGRAAETAAHLTSTPYKERLEQKKSKTKLSKPKPTANKARLALNVKHAPAAAKVRLPFSRRKRTTAAATKERRKKSSKRNEPDDCSEEEDWPCLICAEPFSNSRENEEWVACVICQKWAHDECTKGEHIFVCPNCESDDSDD